jgi:choline dehydrogenase
MYDYVIVGAGSAGCVLANRLSADPNVTVALIEAGGRDRKREIQIPAAFSKLFKTPLDWAFETRPQKFLDDRELFWPRGKMLGGSSSINAMMWVRGHRADYDGWNLPGWSYDEVLPYFHRIEHRVGSNHHHTYGTNGPMWIEELRDPNPLTAAFLAACGEIGLRRNPELNEPDTTGFAPTPVTMHRGRRWSAADAYLHPVRKRPNLTVITGGLAERVLIADGADGPVARGIVYRGESGDAIEVTARREVVLAAGAIGSPHLLMLSGIGDPDRLAAAGVPVAVRSLEVGRNLQDHLASGWIVHTPTAVTMVDAEKLGQVLKYLARRKGMLSSNVAEAVAMVHTEDGLPAPDIEIIFAPVPFLDHGFTEPPGHGFTVATILLQPHSVGEITLASADPAVAPHIDPHYLSDDADLRCVLAGLTFARNIMAAPSLARHVGAPMRPDRWPTDDADLETFVRTHSETLYHPVGTCRMGADESSVVDAELRVRGVSGLRVADASVMPRINRGHTNAPTIMIAERAAELIAAGSAGSAGVAGGNGAGPTNATT